MTDAQAPDPADSQQHAESRPSARRRLSAKLFGGPPDDNNEYPYEIDDLRLKLATTSNEKAADILEEARELSGIMVEGRVESVERRAATLQGVVAIATTFVLTGGTLIIAQIEGRAWRAGAGLVLLWCVGSLAACGWLATQASSQYRRWVIPRRHGIFQRRAQTTAQGRVARAAEILYAAGHNSKHARWKVTKLRKAVSYLRIALAGLVAFAALVLAYSLAGPGGTTDVSGSSAGSCVQRHRGYSAPSSPVHGLGRCKRP